MITAFFINAWIDFDEDKQQKYIFRVIENVPPHIIWHNTKKRVQRENILKLLEKYERDPMVFLSIFGNTDKELQREIFDEVLGRLEEYKEENGEEIDTPFGVRITNNKIKLSEFWIGLNNDLKMEKFDIVLKKIKNNGNRYDIRSFWLSTPGEIQRKHMDVFEEELNKLNIMDDVLKNGTDNEVLIKCFPAIFKKETGVEIPDKINERINKLYGKNHSICKEININFLCDDDIFEDYDEEKILRMTNSPMVQSFMVHTYDNPIMRKMIEYLINNDENWVISLDRLMQNENNYSALISTLRYKDSEWSDLSEEFLQQLTAILMDKNDYFGVIDKDDKDNLMHYFEHLSNIDLSSVNNYFNKKNKICLDILKGNLEEIEPKILANLQDKVVHNMGDLYKFALLEYKFGIDLEEAKRLVTRYGKDSMEMPESELKDYLIVLRDIVECDNIEEVIKLAIQENTLDDPWKGFPDARNVEGRLINFFADLYNETFYNPLDEKNKKDKNSEKAIYYINKEDGTKEKCEIDVYTVQDDFNMSVRVEGAYAKFEEPSDFKEYYNLPNLLCHGNCQSYIGNDLIATARNTGGIMVAYASIGKNNLTALAPYDISSKNRGFSIFNERSEYRLPKNEKDNTRHTHNEMVQERLIIDKDGNVSKLQPSYIVWIEEDTKEERSKANWKEKRENDKKWIMTKKAAAQLEVPIVVIDREYFMERETEKINLMKKLIINENVSDSNFLDEFKHLTKPELVKEIITKFENNATGLQFSNKLKDKFFTQEQMEHLMADIENAIENMQDEEKKECIAALANIAEKESRETENDDKKDFYENELKVQRTNLAIIENETVPKLDDNEIEELADYVKRITDTNFYDDCTVHSIEHIQKVMLFSNVLAKGEGLSDEDRRLLLLSAALHDCAREGNDGNVPHAKQSAEKAGALLMFHKDLFGYFNDEEITIIQTAIHYHEFEESTKGKVEYRKIEELISKYSVPDSEAKTDIDRVIKICELLKDADALDRLRFADSGRLEREFLRTETAKKQLVLNYAEEVNEEVAKSRLIETYGIKQENIESGHAVRALKKMRAPNVYMAKINETEYVEPKFSAKKFIEIMRNVNDKLNKRNSDVADSNEENIRKKKIKKDLYMLYFKNGITRNDCKREQAKLNEHEKEEDVKDISEK